MELPDIYAELGVRKRINAGASMTVYGGSILAPGVREAIIAASRHYVDVNELQVAVSNEIARLTRNEAAFVSGGAAAGLAVVTAAIMAGKDPAKIFQLPDTAGLKNEVICFRNQRVVYDHAVRQIGAKLVEVGIHGSLYPWSLESAINERTAFVLFIHGKHLEANGLPLKQVVEIAHSKRVPVVVDAADQLPPVENLWQITGEQGADVVIFSGGKGLRGPQSTGLVLGRREIIEACRLNSAPNHSIGRPMKVSKEDMCGALAAVSTFVGLDHGRVAAEREAQCAAILDAVRDVPGVQAVRRFPSVVGLPVPQAVIRLEAPQTLTASELITRLRDGEPSILALTEANNGVGFFTGTLLEGEERIIAQRLRAILTGEHSVSVERRGDAPWPSK